MNNAKPNLTPRYNTLEKCDTLNDMRLLLNDQYDLNKPVSTMIVLICEAQFKKLVENPGSVNFKSCQTVYEMLTQIQEAHDFNQPLSLEAKEKLIKNIPRLIRLTSTKRK